MRQLRLRGVKFAQNHTTSESQSLEKTQVCLIPKPNLVTRMLYYILHDRKLSQVLWGPPEEADN